MASWREIEQFRKDAKRCRALAASLLALPDLNPWEVTFLESIASKVALEQFSTRQCESLLQVRDDAVLIEVFHGFNVQTLIRRCYEARLDLSEADEEWLTELHERSATSIKRGQVRRLMGCARQLGFVDAVPA